MAKTLAPVPGITTEPGVWQPPFCGVQESVGHPKADFQPVGLALEVGGVRVAGPTLSGFEDMRIRSIKWIGATAIITSAAWKDDEERGAGAMPRRSD